MTLKKYHNNAQLILKNRVFPTAVFYMKSDFVYIFCRMAIWVIYYWKNIIQCYLFFPISSTAEEYGDPNATQAMLQVGALAGFTWEFEYSLREKVLLDMYHNHI